MNTTLHSVTDDVFQDGRLIYLLDDDKNWAATLLLQLTEANYAVRLFTELNNLPAALEHERPPAAIILNTSFSEDDNAGIEAISQLKQERQTLPPVLFTSNDSSVARRLAAVRAGGQFFFTEPVDHQALFSALDHALATATKPSVSYKVLIVDDVAAQSRYYQEALCDERLNLKVLRKPLDILHTLNHFKADVIVIRLKLSACSGLELGQVIRQYGATLHTPIIFLYAHAEEALHLEAMSSGGDTFTSQSTKPEQLVNSIIARAKQTNSRSQLDQQLLHHLERSEFYHFAMDQHNIVSITDISGRISDVNEQFCAISGYSKEQLIGQNHRLIKSSQHDKALYEDMWHTIRAGKVWHGEICNLTKNGREYWVNSTIVPFLDRKGEPWQYISVRTDITALRISEDRLHRAQNIANIGTWDWDIGSGELHWSDCIGPLFGHSPGTRKTSYENFQAAIHPDDRHLVNLAIEDCIEHGLEYNIEHRIVWPDGSVHWAHESGDVIRNRRGDGIRMLGVVQDISRRKEIELGLKEEQRRLNEAQRIGTIGDWWLDLCDNQLHCSEQALRIFGLQESDKQLALEQTFAQIDPEDRLAMSADEKNVVDLGQSKIDVRIYPNGKNLHWVQIARQVVRDKKGQVTGFRGTVQDITERKEAEQKQEDNRRILENIAKDAPLSDTLTLLIEQVEATLQDRLGAILTIDPVSGQMQCGAAPSLPPSFRATVNTVTIDARQILYKARIISDISSHADWQDFREAISAAGCFICCTRTIQSSSGQLLGILLMFSTTQYPLDSDCVSLTNELTRFTTIALEQKQILWSLMEAKQEADKANQAKSQFLSRISHDLRTPLTAIMGFGQLLNMDKNSPLSDRQSAGVAEINNASEHLLELIDEILDLSQIESGHMALHLEAINTFELVAECEALISPLASERDITFTSTHCKRKKPCGHPYRVEADRKRLKQVLLNLISNAVKYNRHGGSISINCALNGKNLRIEITDTGEGLSNDQQGKLFSAFERLGAEHSSTKGSGIGLVIAKGLIENMAGSIGVKSEPGKGSTFWIELPTTLERL
ncbi:MAG: PAS domain-containing protein [Candidatus Reddybacter sp.]